LKTGGGIDIRELESELQKREKNPKGGVLPGDLYLGYTLAAAVVLVTPGPTILQVIAYSLERGRRVTGYAVVGVVLGDFTALTLSLAGLGLILSTSAALFTLFKWIGALYLIYLGIRTFFAPVEKQELEIERRKTGIRTIMGRLFVITALNPKGICFFIAFLPQFVSRSGPVFPQLVLLGGTFLVMAAVNVFAYSHLAGFARERLLGRKTRTAFNRVGGGILVAAGLMTAASHRAG
jgi:threonine/homoserine/homoserine lactone efflux protein